MKKCVLFLTSVLVFLACSNESDYETAVSENLKSANSLQKQVNCNFKVTNSTGFYVKLNYVLDNITFWGDGNKTQINNGDTGFNNRGIIPYLGKNQSTDIKMLENKNVAFHSENISSIDIFFDPLNEIDFQGGVYFDILFTIKGNNGNIIKTHNYSSIATNSMDMGEIVSIDMSGVAPQDTYTIDMDVKVLSEKTAIECEVIIKNETKKSQTLSWWLDKITFYGFNETGFYMDYMKKNHGSLSKNSGTATLSANSFKKDSINGYMLYIVNVKYQELDEIEINFDKIESSSNFKTELSLYDQYGTHIKTENSLYITMSGVRERKQYYKLVTTFTLID